MVFPVKIICRRHCSKKMLKKIIMIMCADFVLTQRRTFIFTLFQWCIVLAAPHIFTNSTSNPFKYPFNDCITWQYLILLKCCFWRPFLVPQECYFQEKCYCERKRNKVSIKVNRRCSHWKFGKASVWLFFTMS